MGLFGDIYVPAIPILARLEARGIPLDLAKRDQFRDETIKRLDAAKTRIAELTQAYHAQRRRVIEEAIVAVQARLTQAVAAPAEAACVLHTAYRGLTKRAKCDGCAGVFAGAADLRARVKDLRGRVAKGRALLKRLGPAFQATNDHHWRWLLFDETGLGLKPVAYTDKAKLPQVDDDAIEKLMFRHPEIELLRLRVEAKQSEARLTRRLGMEWNDEAQQWASVREPDAAGRLHFAYAFHRSTGRVSSGADPEEDGKERDSPGNLQNVPEVDRQMFVAEPGFVLMARDQSQVEARVTAWYAQETEMLDLWRKAEADPGNPAYDIHCVNALVMWEALNAAGMWKGVPPSLEGTRNPAITFMFAGAPRTFRYANKRRTHGYNYGLREAKASRMYGTPIEAERAALAAYFSRWRRIAAWQEEEFEAANKKRWVQEAFGRKLWFWDMRWNKKAGRWEIDKEGLLAFKPQVSTAMKMIQMLPGAEALGAAHGGELLTTTHDSLTWMVPDRPEARAAFAESSKALMETPWPELGEIEGFGLFRCPTDLSAGYNWGEASEANPGGMKKVKP